MMLRSRFLRPAGRKFTLTGCLMAGVLTSSAAVAALPDTQAAGAGEEIFNTRCKVCHDLPGGAPSRADLATLEHAAAFESLATGKMADNASGLTPEQMHAVAAFVTGKAAPPGPNSPAGGVPPTPPRN